MTSYVLIDGKNAVWRAASVMSNLAVGGSPTGGIHGFFLGALKMVDEFGPNVRVVACWDDWKVGPKARRDMVASYKMRSGKVNAQREEAANQVREQLPILRNLLSLLGVKQAWAPEWEADDVMGTLAKLYANKKRDVVIYTGDRDLLQCAGPRVVVARPMFNGNLQIETPKTVLKSTGVTVEQFIDYKALMGDSGDNISGCPGIGEKTAFSILNQFQTLDRALDVAKSDPTAFVSERFGKLLVKHEQAVLDSRRLATINLEAPVRYIKRKTDLAAARKLLMKLRMTTLLSQFQKMKALTWEAA